MNSLTELNGFVGSFTLTYEDERLPNVLFDRTIPTNQTQSVDRGFTLSASIGIDITEILNGSQSIPSYSIDVSNLNGATVTWASLPTGVSVANPSTGVYIISGFQDKSQWDLIKNPTIDFSDDYYGSWTYSSTISYFSLEEGPQTKSWTTAVTVNNIIFWTTSTQFIYETSTSNTLSGVPLLGNLDTAYPGATWSVTVTPSTTLSIDTFTTSGVGGTFSVNSSTKVITISGTRSQVNNRLQGLSITSNANAVDFVLSYFVSNNVNAVTDTRTQTLISQGLARLGSVTEPTIYYTEDTAFLLTGAPQITDVPYDGTGNYFYTITPSTVSAINSVVFAGSGGTVSFNNSTKVISIQGTRSEINGRLSYITITPGIDFQSNFNLQYELTTPRADTASKIQVALIGSADTEIVNMNLNRNYTANNYNLIFSSTTPQISDNDATNPNYTVIVDCAQGKWNIANNYSPFVAGIDSPTNSLSITGTKDYINGLFQKITFYPNVGVSANTTFTYTQFKNGVQQVNQTVALIGSSGTYNNARSIIFTYSQTYKPDIADLLYGKIDTMLMVGGGGGGGGPAGASGGGGGGGGGVRYVTTDILFSDTTYEIIVGAGGAGGGTAVVDGISGSNGSSGGTTSAFGYSISGGGGGFRSNSGGSGGTSGPQIGLTNDNNGSSGGSQSTINNNLGGRNGGGGGGHYTINGQTSASGTGTVGGRGQYGADEPNGPNSYWGSGGGGGGSPNRGAGSFNNAGASPSLPANYTTSNNPVLYHGGGGGGGFASYAGGNGYSGVVKINITSR